MSPLPTTKDVKDEYVSFKGGYSLTGQKLTFTETISLGKRIYNAAEWPAYREAVNNQKHFANQKIILKK
jgi:hypothetical protein